MLIGIKQSIYICSGVSRISARGVLKVRPDTKSGGGGGGLQFASGPIRKVVVGGGGGGGVKHPEHPLWIRHCICMLLVSNVPVIDPMHTHK